MILADDGNRQTPSGRETGIQANLIQKLLVLATIASNGSISIILFTNNSDAECLPKVSLRNL